MYNVKPLAVALCDFYKLSHREQYPKGTRRVYSNLVPRKSLIPNVNEVVVFGLQTYVKEYLQDYFNDQFFNVPVELTISEYRRLMKYSLGIEDASTKHIEDLHALGYLPLEIKAIAEGTVVPFQTPTFTIENTHDDFFWLTNFVETSISAELWQMSTTATVAREFNKILTRYAKETVGNTEHVPFQLHDFSFRGMGGVPGAMKSGMAHLTSFVGTDTIPAIYGLERFYGARMENELIAASIPATEHSVMCAHGKDEIASFREFITQTYPKGFVSIVSDTWDFWNVIGTVLAELKDDIMARDGRVVIRPDSGVPEDILCGTGQYLSHEDLDIYEGDTPEEIEDMLYEYLSDLWSNSKSGDYDDGEPVHTVEFRHFDGTLKRAVLNVKSVQRFEVSVPGDYDLTITDIEETLESKGLIQALWEIFGGTINALGYKVLDPHIGAIYGDSITVERAEEICKRLKEKGFASSNVVLGVGSYSYQFKTRDSLGYAIKATYVQVEDEERMIFKEPKTDSSKKSLKGRVVVFEEAGRIQTQDGLVVETEKAFEKTVKNLLEPVFRNGEFVKVQTLADIRQRLAL